MTEWTKIDEQCVGLVGYEDAPWVEDMLADLV